MAAKGECDNSIGNSAANSSPDLCLLQNSKNIFKQVLRYGGRISASAAVLFGGLGELVPLAHADQTYGQVTIENVQTFLPPDTPQSQIDAGCRIFVVNFDMQGYPTNGEKAFTRIVDSNYVNCDGSTSSDGGYSTDLVGPIQPSGPPPPIILNSSDVQYQASFTARNVNDTWCFGPQSVMNAIGSGAQISPNDQRCIIFNLSAAGNSFSYPNGLALSVASSADTTPAQANFNAQSGSPSPDNQNSTAATKSPTPSIGSSTPTPTKSPSAVSSTQTPGFTPSPDTTPIAAATSTPDSTPTTPATPTPDATPTVQLTPTPDSTATVQKTGTSTVTITATSTRSTVPTQTSTSLPSPTVTATPTPSSTPTFFAPSPTVTPTQAPKSAPGWKIGEYIFTNTDANVVESDGPHHVQGQLSQAQVQFASDSFTAFITQDLPALTSGEMVPQPPEIHTMGTINIEQVQTCGYGPTQHSLQGIIDPKYDYIDIVWPSSVKDVNSGQPISIENCGGYTLSYSNQGLTSIQLPLNLDNRNVWKHEAGHEFLNNSGEAAKVDNHQPENYVNCTTGQPYVLQDETNANPIPNSIYNDQSGFTKDYLSGLTALATAPNGCLGVSAPDWAKGGPVTKPA